MNRDGPAYDRDDSSRDGVGVVETKHLVCQMLDLECQLIGPPRVLTARDDAHQCVPVAPQLVH